jgi:hypothetical protein
MTVLYEPPLEQAMGDPKLGSVADFFFGNLFPALALHLYQAGDGAASVINPQLIN